MKPSDINERIKRIKYRVEKEYVFDEASEWFAEMRADLVWTIKAIEQFEVENASLKRTVSLQKKVIRWF